MRYDTITFSSHALQRMFERAIPRDQVLAIIEFSDLIHSYPDDEPYPSRLLLGAFFERPVHVVLSRDEKDYACIVVTAYIPSAKLWGKDFKTRK